VFAQVSESVLPRIRFLCSSGRSWSSITTFKIGGLVAVSFWSMVAVVASGVLGRYLCPRSQ
jgi:hypothetical protein